MRAKILDAVGQQYGRLPHELLELGAYELAFDYEVMAAANPKT